MRHGVAFAGNSTAIHDMSKRMAEYLTAMFRRKEIDNMLFVAVLSTDAHRVVDLGSAGIPTVTPCLSGSTSLLA